MIRKKPPDYQGAYRWPRTSGDDPSYLTVKAHSALLAPHERG